MTHQEYISSAKWLLKKHELIRVYLEQGWKINCCICGSTDSLNVHHTSYTNFENEIVTDGRIWELVFVCRKHHQEIHRDKNYKENFFNLMTTEENLKFIFAV